MPDRGKAVGNIVKWGVKYGPHVVVLAQQAKDPAMAAAKKAMERQKARRRAVEHAATVREGSVLKTFDPRQESDEPVWVVFSGEEPIAAHPTTTTPLAELVARSDLTMRKRPHEMPSTSERVRQLPRQLPKRRPR
ncbi:hypothetical protein [Knoellia sp. p5-6-4]|uniref:hypothetical protein n=1 Tax=unclassified Knoellia TaxID=2618719 RepID=UPI0023DBF077|nr:hypothetical protein [Knoellia sp. p5-6-4]MDF2145572.1 hypothetical protein [Knoellia sp. p5-6-4]